MGSSRRKSEMTSVRFAPDVAATVKRFAREDGMTVSAWVRRLVARELKRPRPVNFRDYPTSQTVPSGAGTRISWAIAPSGGATRTGS
jgi:hypothetical protein